MVNNNSPRAFPVFNQSVSNNTSQYSFFIYFSLQLVNMILF